MEENELLGKIVTEFNSILESENSYIRLKLDPRGLYAVDFTLIGSVYVESYVLNLSKDFYNKLESFLKHKFSIHKVNYNNTKSCFWLG